MKKFTKDEIEILKGFWKDVGVAQTAYYDAISFIEQQIHHVIGIEVEVFHVDGEPVGFGDSDREYKLYDIVTKQ